MFKKYGFLGALMIILVQINFFINFWFLTAYYFPIIWLGYILVIDALVYKINNKSLINNKPKLFISLFILSVFVWWIFEFLTIFLQNWVYVNIPEPKWLNFSIAFSTVIPAVFETFELIKSVHIFDDFKISKRYKITKNFLYLVIGFGLFSLIEIVLVPKYFFPFTWLAFFFLLDPFNYLHNKPSIIKNFTERKLKIPLSLFLAGMVCGFFWEFWNYFAVPGWRYNIPFFDFLRIFEMPILGYFGYGFFAWELYSIYYFIASLFYSKPPKI